MGFSEARELFIATAVAEAPLCKLPRNRYLEFRNSGWIELSFIMVLKPRIIIVKSSHDVLIKFKRDRYTLNFSVIRLTVL